MNKLSPRLQRRLDHLMNHSNAFSNPEFTIPVKLVPDTQYCYAILEIRIAPNQRVKKTEIPEKSSLQLILETTSQSHARPVCFHNTEYPLGYVIARLSMEQIFTFKELPYVKQIDDDSPLA